MEDEAVADQTININLIGHDKQEPKADAFNFYTSKGDPDQEDEPPQKQGVVFEEIKDETKKRIQKLKMESVPSDVQTKKCDCKATVLIVDDNPFNLMPLNMLLKKEGLTVIEAHNGAIAVEKFTENR